MNFDSINFRNANMNDISSIMNIELASFSKEICETKTVFLERINIFSKGFRVMEYNKEIIGYVSSEIWEYRDNITVDSFSLGHSIAELHNPKGKEIYISSIGLLPEYRGKGLGRFMFENFLEYCKNELTKIESAILIVSDKWNKAKNIYIENGFKRKIEINNFFNYKNPMLPSEDGIVMRRKFKNRGKLY